MIEIDRYNCYYNNMYIVNEDDWKLFKEKLPLWQERYIKKCLNHYSFILNKDDNPSIIFYELLDSIIKDRNHPGVAIDRCSRSNMLDIIDTLIKNNVITFSDLKGFTEPLITTINMMNKR